MDDIAALRREIADLSDRLAEVLETTGCTNPLNIERDRAARDFVAWWFGDDGRAYRARIDAVIAWHQHQTLTKDEARQRLADMAQKLGIWATVFTLVSGVVMGVIWAATHLPAIAGAVMRSITGGAP